MKVVHLSLEGAVWSCRNMLQAEEVEVGAQEGTLHRVDGFCEGELLRLVDVRLRSASYRVMVSANRDDLGDKVKIILIKV